MRKIYYLSTCNTCKRILDELPIELFERVDIKNNPIDATTLDFLAKESGSYASLFNKRARKYHALGLKEVLISDEMYRKYLLQEYTFLKRPIIIFDGHVFIGNSKKVVTQAKEIILSSST